VGLTDGFAPFVPGVPQSHERYADVYADRIKQFPQCEELLINPRKLTIGNNDQSQGWRHKLVHDAESVFWLLLYWAMVAQPKDHPREHINAAVWTNLLGDSKERNSSETRQGLIHSLSNKLLLKDLTHSAYEPLETLICELASFLVVDSCWLPASDVRKHPEYLNEAFQRIILQFIFINRDKDFMNCAIDTTFRPVQEVPQSQALSSTRNMEMDAAERSNEAKHPRLDA
jgi:hypothetical protein